MLTIIWGMKLIIDSIENINKMVAEEFLNLVKEKPNAILGLATGSTPVGVYQKLSEAYRNKEVSFKNVKSFNLDEYLGLPEGHDQSYKFFMYDNLFKNIDIDLKNTNFPSVSNNYDSLIEQSGGIDLQILGIGRDGHIAFNEPNTSFESMTHIADLTKETIEDNSRFFNSIDEVPTKAVTMGLSTIMKSKKIVLLAFGKNKAQAIKDTIEGPINEKCPASILQRHKDVTIYCDLEAASLLKKPA